jgi:hypothetical protein
MTDVLVDGPGLYLDIPEDRYHRDDALAPELGRSLSSSGAKALTTRTPAHFAWEQVHGRPDRKVFDIGHAAHRFILGRGNEIQRVHARDWRTAAAKAEAAEARLAGRVPLLAEDYRAALGMAKAVKRHPTFGQLFTDGDPEVSGYWIDPDTGVTCRARADWLHPRALIDVKTCDNAGPAAFAKAVANLRYDIPAAAYSEGFRILTGELLPFVFVCVEKEPPHLTAAYVLPADSIEQGRHDWHVALARFAECESAGVWPGHSPEIQTLDMPAWYYRQTA